MQKTKSFMAIISIFFISLLIFIPPSSSSSTEPHRPPSIKGAAPPSSGQVKQACKATRFPQLCESSLSRSPKTKPMEILQSAVSVSSENLRVAQTKLKAVLVASAGNANKTIAAKRCIDYLKNTEYRLKSTTEALPRGKMKDCRAWTSAGLSYQKGCVSALTKMNDTKIVQETVSVIETLNSHVSNALSMMIAYDVFADKMASWSPPKTERDGFWERTVSGGGGGGGGQQPVIPAGLKPDVTVCAKGKLGGCKFSTVQAAVNAAPDWSRGRRFVIMVKAGVYKETVRVGLEKQNVVVLGEGMGKTVITGSLSVGLSGISTFFTATFGVVGDGFMARDLTFENTAGIGGFQAVAFRSDSDRSVIEKCEFLGNQDTLYLHSLRHFFKSCNIQGNVDFIFGNGAAIFQDCTILVRPRQLNPEVGEDNAVTAHAKEDPAQPTGFVFDNCSVNGTEEYMKLYYKNPKVHKNYLGRPWREYSRTVFIRCKLEALIAPEGWTPWPGNAGLKTLYYGEFGNTGKGSDMSKRVAWSSKIPAEHVNAYSIVNFIQGDQWKLTSS